MVVQWDLMGFIKMVIEWVLMVTQRVCELETGHRNSWFTHKKPADFSYVGLSEASWHDPQLDKSWSSLVHLEDLPYHPTTKFGDVRIRTWFWAFWGTSLELLANRVVKNIWWLSHLPKKNCRVCGDQCLISMVENKTIFDTTSHLLSIKGGWKRPHLQMMFP